MQSRGLKVRTTRFIATGISIGLLLACGDDDTADAKASTSDDGGVSPRDNRDDRDNKAGASGKSSGGQGGSSRTAGSGGTSGEAPAAGKGGDRSRDNADTSQASAGTKAPAAGKGGSGDEDAGSSDSDAQPESLKVSVRFKAKVGKEDFACGHKYAGQGTALTTVTPRDLRMFVYDVALIRIDGAKIPVTLNLRAPWQSEKLALLDFEDNTGRCAAGNKDVNTAITGTVPPGSYKGISFVSGVPEDLNHMDPMLAGAPLESAASLRSSALAGFRFATIELVQPAAAGAPFGVGLLHLGSTECASTTDGTVACAKPNRNAIQFDAFDVGKNSIVIDVGTLFSQTDLTQTQECHSTEAICESMFTAVGVDYATGKPKAGQTLFSVE